jgi:hypothetical protein
MKHSRQLAMVVLFALSVTLLASCTVKSGAFVEVCTDLPGDISCKATTFEGEKSYPVRAEAGQTLSLAYDVAVSKGSLEIQVRNPDGDMVWEVSIEDAAADTIELSIDEDGRYSVVLKGDGMGGEYDVSWDVELTR